MYHPLSKKSNYVYEWSLKNCSCFFSRACFGTSSALSTVRQVVEIIFSKPPMKRSKQAPFCSYKPLPLCFSIHNPLPLSD
uniref:Uncharacterized protein n=1 Tax=Arundo donax TaxID=35708 RepID=A0A0A8XW95_ARUDO